MENGVGSGHVTGLFASLRNFCATLAAIAQTRLELLANEIEEEKLRFGQLVLFGTVALFSLIAGGIFLAIFLTVLLWDSHRLLVLGGLAVAFFSLGGAAALMFRARMSTGSRLFSASLAELKKDRQQLLP